MVKEIFKRLPTILNFRETINLRKNARVDSTVSMVNVYVNEEWKNHKSNNITDIPKFFELDMEHLYCVPKIYKLRKMTVGYKMSETTYETYDERQLKEQYPNIDMSKFIRCDDASNMLMYEDANIPYQIMEECQITYKY